jgi:DNA mismatch repair protein MutS2
VTLKTAGLVALMAKAGLYLPIDAASSSSGDGGGSEGGQEGHATVRLAWFDRVLADIGDAQSLEQSLSTFSGHVRRIQRILGAATPASLVLLDEVRAAAGLPWRLGPGPGLGAGAGAGGCRPVVLLRL